MLKVYLFYQLHDLRNKIMPTIQEISRKRTNEKSHQENLSDIKYYLKIVILLSLVIFVCVYFIPAKVVNIPDNVYEAAGKSYFKELFETPHKKVIWFGADCPVSKRKKDLIDMLMNKSELDKYYEHRPFLQNYLDIQYTDTTGRFIMQMCPSGYCIIDPSLRKLARTDDKRLIPDMFKYLDNTNW